ncbi:hypothetical protein E3E36_04205 [Thermococcus sp. M36]|uniref:hypothetical protein n=1 Tax=Thermococcus sp. M36 TaxID=1638261 RepID=UPI00143A2F1B|nr:hypothetical protein [Thermococcus sp. M36]NJE05355.1 hypothetical protein [Thermococcus sp. M36]
MKIRLDNKNGERTTFTPRQSVINNIVGNYTERIAQEYISMEIIPRLKENHEYVAMYGPNVRIFTREFTPLYANPSGKESLPYWHRLHETRTYSSDNMEAKSLKTALEIIKLAYPASWVLPPDCKRIYIKKTTDEFGYSEIVSTACKQDSIFTVISPLRYRMRSGALSEALNDTADWIRHSCFVTERSKDGLLKFYNILKESKYAPDFIIIALDVVGEKKINVSSRSKSLQIRKTFKLPVIDVKRLIVVETKSTKPQARVEFSTSQKKFLELFSNQDLAEFLLIYIPVDDMIPLKNIPIIMYHFLPGEIIDVNSFRRYKRSKNTLDHQ